MSRPGRPPLDFGALQIRPLVRRAARGLLRAVAIAAALSVSQVALVRFVDPWLTWTMVERVFDRRAETGRWAWVDHRARSLDDLGDAVARAAVASEDARFFLHHGFDLEGICAAMAKNRKAGETVAGGSTISQQVARNVFLWQGRSWLRKGLETWYTAWLELLVPKERILELYLNVAETGILTFGVEAGSWRYYKGAASAMTPDEAARLASLLPAPRHWTIDGAHARKRATWISANPAPFPGDPGFDEIEADWDARPAWPERCRR